MGRVQTALLFLFAVGIGGRTPILLGQASFFLDLTAPRLPEEDDGCQMMGGGSWGGSSGPAPELSLALEIDNIERVVYRVGENVTYQIRLTNTGNKPVAIPWGRDSWITDPSCPSSRYWNSKGPKLKALFGLQFTVMVGGATQLAYASLYGTMDHPDTYRVLQPHESALVRATDTVDAMHPHHAGELGIMLGLPRKVTVHGYYILSDSSLPNPYKALQSKNEVIITIDKRE